MVPSDLRRFEGDHEAWIATARPHNMREGLRYASELTDAEWKVIEPLMSSRSPIGRPRKTDLRAVVSAILYMASTGCQWRQLPREFPPRSTVQGYFYEWSRSGRFRAIDHMLVMAARETAGREASPTAGVIDSQSVKTTESGGPRGFDAGKKIKGCKRHIVTDTEGHLVGLQVHAADIQDRDGAFGVLASIRSLYPWLRHVFADGGYAGDKLRDARRRWIREQGMLNPARLVFIDETAVSTNMARLRGRALRRNDIVVMDNCRIHLVAGVREAIEKAQATLRYLPKYSSDLNPFETEVVPLPDTAG